MIDLVTSTVEGLRPRRSVRRSRSGCSSPSSTRSSRACGPVGGLVERRSRRERGYPRSRGCRTWAAPWALEAHPDRPRESIGFHERVGHFLAFNGFAARNASRVRLPLSPRGPCRSRRRSCRPPGQKALAVCHRAVARNDLGRVVGHRQDPVGESSRLTALPPEARSTNGNRALHHHVAGMEHVRLAPVDHGVAVGMAAAGEHRRSCRRSNGSSSRRRK